MQPSPTNTLPAFELKGSMFTLTVLNLLTSDLIAFAKQLEHHVEQTPNFFNNMPVVIDLKKLSEQDVEIDFLGLVQHLRQRNLIPVGVRHGNDAQNKAAQSAQLALLSAETIQRNPSKSASKKNVSSSEATAEPISHPKSLIISYPVRSGQQVYARNANLIILSSVSHGAELLADGHIHVYGHLRGRALAGVQGDQTARIFCHQLEAELISIAGYYKLRDDLPTSLEDAAIMQIYLEDEKIHIEPVLASAAKTE